MLDRAYNRDEDDLYDTRPYTTRSLMHQVHGAWLETPCDFSKHGKQFMITKPKDCPFDDMILLKTLSAECILRKRRYEFRYDLSGSNGASVEVWSQAIG